MIDVYPSAPTAYPSHENLRVKYSSSSGSFPHSQTTDSSWWVSKREGSIICLRLQSMHFDYFGDSWRVLLIPKLSDDTILFHCGFISITASICIKRLCQSSISATQLLLSDAYLTDWNWTFTLLVSNLTLSRLILNLLCSCSSDFLIQKWFRLGETPVQYFYDPLPLDVDPDTLKFCCLCFRRELTRYLPRTYYTSFL